MSTDPRTRGLSETCAQRGPNRPLHTKGGAPNYLEKSLAAAAEPFKGITSDGNLIPDLYGIRKTGVSTQSIREAAEAFLGSLTAEQRAKTLFPVDTDQWRKWSNIHPTLMRHGMPLFEMSDGQREVINAILDEYFTRFTTGVAEARKKSVEDVKALVDDAPYNAVQAKSLGLIDDALYREQVDEALKTQLGYRSEDKLRTVSGGQYREIPSDTLGLNNGEKVAIIYASGGIMPGRSGSGPLSGETVGSDTVVSAVNDAARDTSVKAIVLRVDSPGGSALASDLIWNAIENAKKKKKVVVSMSDVAASGGYYIACNADRIVAEPSSITGSIGVFMGKPVIKGLYDWLGITNEYVMRGRNAGIFRETEKWTPEEREKMVAQTNSIYFDNFVPKVSKGRGKSVEEVNTLGQGRVWTGTQAKQNGLIDDFGGLERAIDIAKELAGLPADKDVRRVVFPAPRPYLEELFGSDEDSELQAETAQAALLGSLPEDVRRAFRFSALFERMQRGDAMLLLPFELSIK